ncbi:tyrosine-type recombinase/integrase [Enterococcus faecium]|uniref:tyrosine-type recombinase/integrase n=1 Tax=Enterococcus faecium TaxID=1352 RepID=UPI0038B5316E
MVIPPAIFFYYSTLFDSRFKTLQQNHLNYRINSIKRRHPDLVHLSPHKLRHTYATIARQGGADMNQISNALTHSDISTTKIYVNTPDIVDKAVFEAFQRGLNKCD